MKTETLKGFWTVQYENSTECQGEYASKASANRVIRKYGGTAIYVPAVVIETNEQKGQAWS